MAIDFDVVLVKKYWNRCTYKTSRHGAIKKLKDAYHAANAVEGDERISDYGDFIDLWMRQSENWNHSDVQMLNALTNFLGRLGFSYELKPEHLSYKLADKKSKRLDVDIELVRERISQMRDRVAANILMLASCGLNLDHILAIGDDPLDGNRLFLTNGKVIVLSDDELPLVEDVLATSDAIDTIRLMVGNTGNPSNDRNDIYQMVSRKKAEDNFPWTYGDVLHIWEIHTALTAGETAVLEIAYRIGIAADAIGNRFKQYRKDLWISADTYDAILKSA